MARHPNLDLDEYLPYLVNRVGMALVASFGEDPLGRHDLSIAMWRVLVALSNNGGQRLVDLGGMTTIDVSTLSRMVARLVRLGLVSRARSKTSEREVTVSLTPNGKKLVAQLIPIALRFERAAVAGIPASDLAIVRRALRRMHENMTRLGRGAK